MRTWTAAAGGFTVEAEFIELKPGDVVHLRTKDGRDIDVPLDKLSPADRAIVRPPKPAPKTVPTLDTAKARKRKDTLGTRDYELRGAGFFATESIQALDKYNMVSGRWTKVDLRHFVGGNADVALCRLIDKPAPGSEYDMHIKVQRLRGEGKLLLGLVGAKGRFYVAVGPKSCDIGRLAGNKRYDVPDLDLDFSKPVRVTCKVRNDVIFVLADKEVILEYDDDQAKLRLPPEMVVPDPRQLFFGSLGADTEWEITSVGMMGTGRSPFSK
jgi:hypothetical protein